MESAARLALLAFAGVLVLNLIQGGPERVRRWLAAKFLGRDQGVAKNPEPEAT